MRNDEQRDFLAPTYSRRALLRTALGAAGAAALAACGGTGGPPAGGGATTTTGTTTTTAAATPTGAARAATVATTTTATTRAAGTATRAAAPAPVAVEGKLPAPLPGVPEAYTRLPPPFKSVGAVPGRGGRATAFLIAYAAPVPPKGENRYWQELDRRIGTAWEPIMQPADGYPEKIAAITAGGDLPDLLFIVPEQVPAQYNLIRQGAYLDLTPYLSGDALKEYPNLALYPDYLWKNVAVNGKVYGPPRPQLRISATLHWRQDWAEKFGIPRPKNADDLAKLMGDFTKGDPDANGRADSYGMGSIAQFVFNLPFFQHMFRVPNLWRKNPDGSLTSAFETEEFRATLAYMRRLYEAGIFHPDTATMNRTQRRDFIISGRVGGVMDNVANFAGSSGFRAEAKKQAPEANVTVLVPPGHDGGPAATDNVAGFFGFTALPARLGRDRERVRELLRLCDYFAAPFASEERIFLGNGLQGVHHEVTADGSRVNNDLGRAEIGDLNSVAGSLTTYYYTIPGDAQEVQNAVRDIQALGQENPALNVYSPTAAARGGELNQLRIDRVGAIVQGREPLSALDTFIRDWKSRGGDQMRKEYEEGLKGT